MKLREKYCNRLKGKHKAAIKIRLNSGGVNSTWAARELKFRTNSRNCAWEKSWVIITAEQAIPHSEESSVFICPNLIHDTLGLPVVTTNAFLFVLGVFKPGLFQAFRLWRRRTPLRECLEEAWNDWEWAWKSVLKCFWAKSLVRKHMFLLLRLRHMTTARHFSVNQSFKNARSPFNLPLSLWTWLQTRWS